MTMISKLRTLGALSVQDKLLFFQAWLLLLLVDIALRIFPFRQVHAWLKVSEGGIAVSADEADQMIRRCADFLDLAARYHLYAMTCLRRSLTLHWLLSRQGVFTELRFGVLREDGKLQAHAWLEYQGQPVGEKSTLTDQYARLIAADR
jgi:hypothetical protein